MQLTVTNFFFLSAVAAQGRGHVPIPDLRAGEGTLGPVPGPDPVPVLDLDLMIGGPAPVHVDLEVTGPALGQMKGENPVLVLDPASAPAKRSPWRKGRAAQGPGRAQQVQSACVNPAPVLLLQRRTKTTVPRTTRHKWTLRTRTSCTPCGHHKTILFLLYT